MPLFGHFDLLQQKITNYLPAWNDFKWVKIIKKSELFHTLWALESGFESFKNPNPDQWETREDPQPWNEVCSLWDNVGDTWHFGADPDPDPQIRTSD